MVNEHEYLQELRKVKAKQISLQIIRSVQKHKHGRPWK